MNKEILIRIKEDGTAQSIYNLQSISNLEISQMLAELEIIKLELLGIISKGRVRKING